MKTYCPYTNLDAQALSRHARQDLAQRQPGDVLGAREVRGQAARAEGRRASARSSRSTWRPATAAPPAATTTCARSPSTTRSSSPASPRSCWALSPLPHRGERAGRGGRGRRAGLGRRRPSPDLASAFLAHLRAELHAPDLSYAATPAALSGGFDTRIFSFRLSGAPDAWSGSLILRVMNPAHDPLRALRERAIQNALATQGYPAPRVLAACADRAPLGAGFLVMERATGRPAARRPGPRGERHAGRRPGAPARPRRGAGAARAGRRGPGGRRRLRPGRGRLRGPSRRARPAHPPGRADRPRARPALAARPPAGRGSARDLPRRLPSPEPARARVGG